jgi:hypothetical protein
MHEQANLELSNSKAVALQHHLVVVCAVADTASFCNDYFFCAVADTASFCNDYFFCAVADTASFCNDYS